MIEACFGFGLVGDLNGALAAWLMSFLPQLGVYAFPLAAVVVVAWTWAMGWLLNRMDPSGGVHL